MDTLQGEKLLVWAAGITEWSGSFAATVQQGPSRMYAAFDLLVPVSNPDQLDRLITAANNGVDYGNGQAFLLGGYAAVRGFVKQLWPYLTPGKRSEINAEIRKYKQMKADCQSRGLTR